MVECPLQRDPFIEGLSVLHRLTVSFIASFIVSSTAHHNPHTSGQTNDPPHNAANCPSSERSPPEQAGQTSPKYNWNVLSIDITQEHASTYSEFSFDLQQQQQQQQKQNIASVQR
jgi:hypothetical protein